MSEHSYPIGKFEPKAFSEALKSVYLNEIRELPSKLTGALDGLSDETFSLHYREGGWTIQQLVHHIADSHINAFVRFRLALTEENPTIKPYQQDEWVKLNDVGTVPPSVSVQLLTALHHRWYATIKDLKDADWHRPIHHPENPAASSLWFFLGLYAWHGKHHVAHILRFRERSGL